MFMDATDKKNTTHLGGVFLALSLDIARGYRV